MAVEQRQLAVLRSKWLSAQQRIAKVKEQSEAITETAIEGMVTSGVAMATGVVDGKTGGIELGGIPAPLIAGAIMHGAAFVGMGGRNAHLLHAAGNGALAAWAYTQGRAIGLEWNAKSKGGASVKGDDFDGLSGEDLRALAE